MGKHARIALRPRCLAIRSRPRRPCWGDAEGEVKEARSAKDSLGRCRFRTGSVGGRMPRRVAQWLPPGGADRCGMAADRPAGDLKTYRASDACRRRGKPLGQNFEGNTSPLLRLSDATVRVLPFCIRRGATVWSDTASRQSGGVQADKAPPLAGVPCHRARGSRRNRASILRSFGVRAGFRRSVAWSGWRPGLQQQALLVPFQEPAVDGRVATGSLIDECTVGKLCGQHRR